MRFSKETCISVLLLAGVLLPLLGCGASSAPENTGGFGMTTAGQAAALANVSINPASVTGGSSSQVTITLTQAAPAPGLTIAMTSSDPSVASAPQNVAIAGGQMNATAAIPTSPVSATTPITISASYNGSIVGANLSVLAPNTTGSFTVTVKPAALTVKQGKSGSTTITTKGSSGFDQALQLTVSKRPSGVTVSLNPKTIAAPGSGTSKLTVNVAGSVATGSYPLSVNAGDGKTSASASLTLTVTSDSSSPGATFKGCWYRQGGHRYQGVDVSVKNAGTYPFNAVLYYGATCNPNSFADQFGFGQPIQFGGFGYTFWFTDFKDQTNMSALWYVGSQSSACVNYAVAPDC